jgi:hypothetical protein
MASPQILSTVVDLAGRDCQSESTKGPWWDQTAEVLGPSRARISQSLPPSRSDSDGGALSTLQDPSPSTDDPEYKLPDRISLFLVIAGNAMSQVKGIYLISRSDDSNICSQISFFIIVSSANAYAEHLGGSSTFSGLTIGVPAVFAALTLIPMVRYDGGQFYIYFELFMLTSHCDRVRKI